MRTKSNKRSLSALSIMVAVMVALTLLVPTLLSGCRASEQSHKDGLGNDLTVNGTPKRIASLSPALTETVFALGLGDRMVGVSTYCNRPAEALDVEKIGDAFSINFEKLVALKPDLVLVAGTKDFETQAEQDMDRLGLPVYASGPQTVAEVLSDIENLAKVLGASKAGEDLAEDLQAEIDGIIASYTSDGAPRPKVFIVVDPDLWTVGPSSFISDVIEVAGGENILRDVPDQYLQISMEDLLTKDPDVIVVAIPEDQAGPLFALPAWDSLSAVREGRVSFVDPDLISRPGPGVVEAIKEAAAAIVPSNK